MMIEIDKDVPITKVVRTSMGSKYPFAHMEVGDSFAVVGDPRKTAANLRNLAGRFAKDNGTKFTVRLTAEGARCWRLE